ncbi:hypothetical protein BH11PLA2_BH11PLA2_35210 [soil metagenome]
MLLRSWLSAAVFGAGSLATPAFAADAIPAAPTAPVAPKAIYTFGTLRTLTPEVAKAKAKVWLESIGKYDAAAFDAVWAADTRPVFDRTIDSLLLGSTEAKAALDAARNPDAPAPTAAPSILKDAAQDPFFRANIATAYAKALGGKRVYEEALEVLKAVTPEQVVDPSQYFFYRAVAEHCLIQKDESTTSIARMLDDVADAPDRYKMVATLMFFDMQNWSPERKDLGNIGRLMDNSGRRLDLARGGQATQDIQKKIVFGLDEKIKELENQSKGNCNGGSCPGGGQPGQGGAQGSTPQADSFGGSNGGAGKVDEKKLRKLAEEWGKLPAAERAKAIAEINKDLPVKFKPMIEEYFKSLNKVNGVNP